MAQHSCNRRLLFLHPSHFRNWLWISTSSSQSLQTIIAMLTRVFCLALTLFSNTSQGAPTTSSTPTPAIAYNRYKKDIIPSGAAVVAPLPAVGCDIRNESSVQTSNKSFAVGEQWMPSIPWTESGQVVFVSTDTEGVKFENLAFDNAPVALNGSRSLLKAYSNSSGWSMTMPSTINVNSKSSETLPLICWPLMRLRSVFDQSVNPRSLGQQLPHLQASHRTIWE